MEYVKVECLRYGEYYNLLVEWINFTISLGVEIWLFANLENKPDVQDLGCLTK